MSNMNTLPQTPKSFNRFEGQDHGTRGNSNRNNDYAHENDYDHRGATRLDKYTKFEAIKEGLENYSESFTPEELDYVADQLLLDASPEEGVEDSEELVDDETDFQRVERHEREDARAREVMGVQQIVFDAIKSRKGGKEYHARQATLDPELDDDDQEDYTPGFHITNRP